MTRSMLKGALAAILLLTSALAPTVSAPARSFAEKGARAQRRVATEAFVRTELFFGTGKSDGTAVTDEEWQAFLDDEVTPRFPDGLTVLAGVGQFRTSEGVVEQERSFVLILLYPLAARKDADLKIEEIREGYKTQFAQESVLRVDDRRPRECRSDAGSQAGDERRAAIRFAEWALEPVWNHVYIIVAQRLEVGLFVGVFGTETTEPWYLAGTLGARGRQSVLCGRSDDTMEPLKDASHLYEVERRAVHAERPGFRISELQIGPDQRVPWHLHSAIADTFYVIEGTIELFLRDPKERLRLAPGETYTVQPRRPHLVTNGGESSATFLVLQGVGEYDYVPLVESPDSTREPR